MKFVDGYPGEKPEFPLTQWQHCLVFLASQMHDNEEIARRTGARLEKVNQGWARIEGVWRRSVGENRIPSRMEICDLATSLGYFGQVTSDSDWD